MRFISGLACIGATVVVAVALGPASTLSLAAPSAKQPVEATAPAKVGNDPLAVPSFWDPRHRPDRPDLSRLSVIRFLTETDYPPFNYAGPDGNPIGFNVDLARAICQEIKAACTIQMRRFDTLVKALNNNQGDAVIASLAETPALRKQVDFSNPYYRTPARFRRSPRP